MRQRTSVAPRHMHGGRHGASSTTADPDFEVPGMRIRNYCNDRKSEWARESRLCNDKPKIGDMIAGAHLFRGGHVVIYAGNIRIIDSRGRDTRTMASFEEPGFDLMNPLLHKTGRPDPQDDTTIGTSSDDQVIRVRHRRWLCKEQPFMCADGSSTIRTSDEAKGFR